MSTTGLPGAGERSERGGGHPSANGPARWGRYVAWLGLAGWAAVTALLLPLAGRAAQRQSSDATRTQRAATGDPCRGPRRPCRMLCRGR